jgi:hypothetical protein
MVRAALDTEESEAGVETVARELAAALNPPTASPGFETKLSRRVDPPPARRTDAASRAERRRLQSGGTSDIVARPSCSRRTGARVGGSGRKKRPRRHDAGAGLRARQAHADKPARYRKCESCFACRPARRRKDGRGSQDRRACPPVRTRGRTDRGGRRRRRRRCAARDLREACGRPDRHCRNCGCTGKLQSASPRRRTFLSVIDTAGFDPRNANRGLPIPRSHASKASTPSASFRRRAMPKRSPKFRRARHAGREAHDRDRPRSGASRRRVLAAATQGADLAHVTRSPFVAGGLETLTPFRSRDF